MGLVVSLSSAKDGRVFSVLPCKSPVRGTAFAWAATFGTSFVVLPATLVEVKVSSVDEKELLPREICVLFVAKIQTLDFSEFNGKGRDEFVSDGFGTSPLNGMLSLFMNFGRQSLIDGLASTNIQAEMNVFYLVSKNRGEVGVDHHLFDKMPLRTVFIRGVFGDIEGGDKKGGESMDCSYCSEIGNQVIAGSENYWLDNLKMCDNWKGILSLKMTDFDEMQFSDEDLGCPEKGGRIATNWIMCWTLRIKGSKIVVEMHTYGLESSMTLNQIASSGDAGVDITYRTKCADNDCKIARKILPGLYLAAMMSWSILGTKDLSFLFWGHSLWVITAVETEALLTREELPTTFKVNLGSKGTRYFREVDTSLYSLVSYFADKEYYLTPVKTKNGCIKNRDFLVRFPATGKLFFDVQLDDITGLKGTEPFRVPSTCLLRSGWVLRLSFYVKEFAKSFDRKWGITYASPGIDMKAMFSTDFRKEIVDVIMEFRSPLMDTLLYVDMVVSMLVIRGIYLSMMEELRQVLNNLNLIWLEDLLTGYNSLKYRGTILARNDVEGDTPYYTGDISYVIVGPEKLNVNVDGLTVRGYTSMPRPTELEADLTWVGFIWVFYLLDRGMFL